jgi:antitoxin component of MazEF toxin-antitoxin module
MMTVTPAARERLAEALDQMDDQTPEDACFRIVRGEDDQLTLSLGVVDEKDVTFEQESKTVLAISPSVAEVCENRTLDIDDNGPEGRSVLTLS